MDADYMCENDGYQQLSNNDSLLEVKELEEQYDWILIKYLENQIIEKEGL